MTSAVPAGRVNVPATIRYIPFVTFQVCAPPPKFKPDKITRYCVAALMLMPLVPRVSVLPGLIRTKPPGLTMLMPAQTVSAPSATVFALVTVESHLAVSNGPGTTPPTQLVVRLRLSVLLVLMIVPARKHAALARTARQARKILMVLVFMGLNL